MTDRIFGPDISNYEAGLNLAQLRNASFVIAKVTEGTYYIDKSYPSWRRQAAAANMLFLWYHFLTRENVAAQVKNNKASVGQADLSLPGMLDVETAYGYTPTLQQVLDYIDQAHAAGLNLRLCYLPRWVWEQMGSPNLGQIWARGVHLVSSDYPGGAGTAPQIYPGDAGDGWMAYGGMAPKVYQFTNQALDGGQRMDYNAFIGTIDQFKLLLDASSTHTGGPDVQLTDTVTVSQGFADRYPAVANPTDGFTAGAQIPVSVLLEGAALRAVNNEKMLTQLVQMLTNPSGLAAAIASHLSGGGGADEATLTQFIADHLKIGLTKQ